VRVKLLKKISAQEAAKLARTRSWAYADSVQRWQRPTGTETLRSEPSTAKRRSTLGRSLREEQPLQQKAKRHAGPRHVPSRGGQTTHTRAEAFGSPRTSRSAVSTPRKTSRLKPTELARGGWPSTPGGTTAGVKARDSGNHVRAQARSKSLSPGPKSKVRRSEASHVVSRSPATGEMVGARSLAGAQGPARRNDTNASTSANPGSDPSRGAVLSDGLEVGFPAFNNMSDPEDPHLL
jgi:hypothetical protein